MIGLVIPFIPELHMASIMEFVSVIANTARLYDHDILLVTEDEGAPGLQRVVGPADLRRPDPDAGGRRRRTRSRWSAASTFLWS